MISNRDPDKKNLLLCEVLRSNFYFGIRSSSVSNVILVLEVLSPKKNRSCAGFEPTTIRTTAQVSSLVDQKDNHFKLYRRELKDLDTS